MTEKDQSTGSGIPEGRVAYLGKSGALVTMVAAAGAAPVLEIFSDLEKGKSFQPWGLANDEPKVWRLKMEANTTAGPLVTKLSSIHFGRGLVYWQQTIGSDGTIQRDYSSIAEVDEFLAQNDIEFLMLQRMMDYYTSGNLWCELLLDKGMKKIKGISHLEAEFCRFGELDAEGKRFLNILYNGDWTKVGDAVPIPFLNRQELNKDTIRKKFVSSKKFSWHSYFPSPGRTIYARPAHAAALKKNGWIDYANSVPEIMNSINTNAWDIRFHVRVPYNYWRSAYEKWDTWDTKKKQQVIDDTFKELDEFLLKSENKGRTFYSHYGTDFQTGKPLPGWEIIPIDDKSKKDAFLTSVQEADIQISRAWGIDSSLTSIQPQGGKMGAGSGSDKRVGFDNQVNTTHAHTLIITEPLRIVGLYNDWPVNLKWGFIHDIPTSLNEDKTGVKTES